MKYKSVIASNGYGGIIVLLENGMYACVNTKRGAFSNGITVMKHLEGFFKWGSFELCTDADVPKEDIESIKYNLENCQQFWKS